jgi:hypothetical protein
MKRGFRGLFPIFKFDFKSGVYLNDESTIKFPHLIQTSAELVKAGKLKPS